MAGSYLAKGLTKTLNNWVMLSATKLRPRADKVDCKAIGSLSVTNGYVMAIKCFEQSLCNWGMHFQKLGVQLTVDFASLRMCEVRERTHNQIIAFKL